MKADPEVDGTESFWLDMGAAVFDVPTAHTTQDVSGLIGLADVGPDDRVLDLPCGTGRHAIELATRGLRVTGVDFTESYLDEARRTAADAGVGLVLTHGDMRS